MNSLTFAGFGFDFLTNGPRVCVGTQGKACKSRFLPVREDHTLCHACYKQERAQTAKDRESAHHARIATCVAWAKELFEANALPADVRVTIHHGVEVHVIYAGTYAHFRSTRLQQAIDAQRKQAGIVRQAEHLARERMEFRAACTEWARMAFESHALDLESDVKLTQLNAQVSVGYASISVTFISQLLKDQLDADRVEAGRKAAVERSAQEKTQREQRAAAAKAKAEAEAAAPKAKEGKGGGKDKGGGKASRKQQARAAA
jgi:hypothetical protein